MVEETSAFSYSKKSSWEFFSDEDIKKAYNFCEGYKKFLSEVKTEREAIDFIVEKAKNQGKEVYVNKNGCAAIVIRGSKPISEGVRLVISHVDSPRLDLKQVPCVSLELLLRFVMKWVAIHFFSKKHSK